MIYSQSSKSNAQASKFLIVQFNFNTKIFEIKKRRRKTSVFNVCAERAASALALTKCHWKNLLWKSLNKCASKVRFSVTFPLETSTAKLKTKGSLLPPNLLLKPLTMSFCACDGLTPLEGDHSDGVARTSEFPFGAVNGYYALARTSLEPPVLENLEFLLQRNFQKLCARYQKH